MIEISVVETLEHVLGQRNFFSLPYTCGSVVEYATQFKSQLEALSKSIDEPEMVAAGVWSQEELGDWISKQTDWLWPSEETVLLGDLIWLVARLVDSLNRDDIKEVKHICNRIRSLV